jgi:hypothetical protein
MKLTKEAITKTINACFDPSPATRAAQILYPKGIREKDMLKGRYPGLEPSARIQVAGALHEMEKAAVRANLCTGCGASLGKRGAVTRLYNSKDTANPDSVILGHYDDKTREFEADGNPSYPLVTHDLVDGSDSCNSCNTVCG